MQYGLVEDEAGSPGRTVRVLRVVAGLDPTIGGPPESTVAACLATEAQGAHNTLLYATDEAGRRGASRF